VLRRAILSEDEADDKSDVEEVVYDDDDISVSMFFPLGTPNTRVVGSCTHDPLIVFQLSVCVRKRNIFQL